MRMEVRMIDCTRGSANSIEIQPRFATRACYSDTKLVPARPGEKAEPKAIAGNDGTQITVFLMEIYRAILSFL